MLASSYIFFEVDRMARVMMPVTRLTGKLWGAGMLIRPRRFDESQGSPGSLRPRSDVMEQNLHLASDLGLTFVHTARRYDISEFLLVQVNLSPNSV